MATSGEHQELGSARATRRQMAWRVLAGLAVAIQVALLLGFFAMGLGWGGLWWYLTVLQAAVGVGLACVALARRPAAALPVPLVSLGLMQAFVELDALVTARVCSPEVVRAAEELGPIPGFTQRPDDFRPELGKGCVSRFNSLRPPAEVIERYRSAGVREGWTLATPQPQDRALLHRGTLVVEVWANTRDDRGMYIMSVRGA